MAGFIEQSNTQEKSPIVPFGKYTHSICVGQTGCGKTSSYLLPNINYRMKKPGGMFIIDYKGNLNLQVKTLAMQNERLQDVIELGVAWGDTINMLSGVDKTLFLKTLENLSNEHDDKFWMTGSLNLVGLIFDMILYRNYIDSINLNVDVECPKYPMQSSTFAEILSSKKSLGAFVTHVDLFLEEAQEMVEKHKNTRNGMLISEYRRSLEKRLKKLEHFHSEIDEDKPASANGGILFQTRNLVTTFDQVGLSGENDILDLLEAGKIVIIRADSYPKNATEAFMDILYTRLSHRDGDLPITLFIDEFQRTITKDSIPHVDVFREMKVELIAAFQSYTQLTNKIGEDEKDEILSNIIDVYEYSQKDVSELEPFEYTYKGKKYKAIPQFLSKAKLYIAQYKWQNTHRIFIHKEGVWVYQKSIDMLKTKIYNIETKETKTYFLGKKEIKKFENSI